MNQLEIKHTQSFWLPDDIWQNVFQCLSKQKGFIQFTDSDFSKHLDENDRFSDKSLEYLLGAIRRETEKIKPFIICSRVCKQLHRLNKINLTTVSNAFVGAMLRKKIAFEDLLYPKVKFGCSRDRVVHVSLFELAVKEKDSKSEVMEVIFRAATAKGSGCSDNEFLNYVCENGWSKAVDLILRLVPNVLRDIPTNNRTPLHAAAEKGQIFILKQLLNAAGNQADELLLRKDGRGRTALEVAETCGRLHKQRAYYKEAIEIPEVSVLYETEEFLKKAELYGTAEFLKKAELYGTAEFLKKKEKHEKQMTKCEIS